MFCTLLYTVLLSTATGIVETWAILNWAEQISQKSNHKLFSKCLVYLCSDSELEVSFCFVFYSQLFKEKDRYTSLSSHSLEHLSQHKGSLDAILQAWACLDFQITQKKSALLASDLRNKIHPEPQILTILFVQDSQQTARPQFTGGIGHVSDKKLPPQQGQVPNCLCPCPSPLWIHAPPRCSEGTA